MHRQQAIDTFLADTDWHDATRSPLDQDASFRRYWRLHQANKSIMLMDAPPPEKPVSQFAKIAQFLRQHGLYAPQIYAFDDANGLMLLEDLGEKTFTRILASAPQMEHVLYQMAIDTLVQLHQIDRYTELLLPAYDTSTLIEEAQLLIQWFYPAMVGKPANQQQKARYDAAWRQCFEALPAHQPVLVLRDYHVDNLMYVRHNNQQIQCGLLDFQDALSGSPAYDLASLLEDARRDISADITSACLDRYFNATTGIEGFANRATLEPWLNVLSAQRHAKVLGIFMRLYKRDKKAHYLKHLPRVLSLFEVALMREPRLNLVTEWMMENLPIPNIDLAPILKYG